MRPHRWLWNPLGSLQAQYRSSLEKLEQDIDRSSIGLPSPANWTQRMTIGILLGLTAGISWAVFARVDVVVDSNGKLEPVSQSQSVQTKMGGTVTTVLVHEGEEVKQGQLLMQLDKTPLLNQLQALMLQRNQLINETAVLRMVQENTNLNELSSIDLSPELRSRVQARLLLVAQLTGDPGSLDPEQRQRYDLFQQQIQDALSVNQLQDSGLDTQIAQMDSQLNQTEFQFNVQQELLAQLQPLMEEGAISRSVFLERAIEVNTLQKQLDQNRMQKRQLQLNRVQSQVQGRQSVTQIYQDLQQQLANLDADFDATIKANQRALIEVASQINQIQLELKNQDLRAPVNGVIASLGAKLPGVIAQPGQTLLQVVPDEALIVRVQVNNADIANIRVGMPVDVRVDAYPFTEFGSIPGVVTKVGSEAVAVEGTNGNHTVFPIEIQLRQQYLERNKKRYSLTPGMSVVANIKVRDRAPISYVTEELVKAIDSMRSVR